MVDIRNIAAGGSAGAAAGTAGAAGSKLVYYGMNPITSTDDAHDRSGSARTPNNLTSDGAKAKFYELSEAERASLGLALYRTGLIKDATDFDAVQAAWNKAVDDAAGFYRGGQGQKVTPWDVLGMKMGIGAAGSAGPPKSSTSTSTSFNIPSKQDAEALLKTIFANALGRDPDGEELQKYTTMMVGLAKANPTKSTTTTSYDSGGGSSSSTTSSGGISDRGLQQAALDKIQADPEYGAYQAATTYYNAAIAALAAPV